MFVWAPVYSRAASGLHFAQRISKMGRISILIKPRLQKDKFSIYWKSIMSTNTEMAGDFKLEVDSNDTIEDVLAIVAKEKGWDDIECLQRVEGYEDEWEAALHMGHKIQPGRTLAEAGILTNDEIVTVRKMLIVEAWRVMDEDDNVLEDDEEM